MNPDASQTPCISTVHVMLHDIHSFIEHMSSPGVRYIQFLNSSLYEVLYWQSAYQQ